MQAAHRPTATDATTLGEQAIRRLRPELCDALEGRRSRLISMASAVLADAVSISGTPCGDVKFAGGGGPAVLLTMDPAQSKLKLLKSLEAPAAKLTAVPPSIR